MATQMDSLKARYGVTTKRALLSAIAREYTAETGERFTQRDADLILDGMLEAEYQRIEGGAYFTPETADESAPVRCNCAVSRIYGGDCEHTAVGDDFGV